MMCDKRELELNELAARVPATEQQRFLTNSVALIAVLQSLISGRIVLVANVRLCFSTRI